MTGDHGNTDIVAGFAILTVSSDIMDIVKIKVTEKMKKK
jgi:hypothetical protein